MHPSSLAVRALSATPLRSVLPPVRAHFTAPVRAHLTAFVHPLAATLPGLGSVTGDIGQSIVTAITNWIVVGESSAVAGLFTAGMNAITTGTLPVVTQTAYTAAQGASVRSWFAGPWHGMENLAILIGLIIFFVGLIANVVRGNTSAMAKQVAGGVVATVALFAGVPLYIAQSVIDVINVASHYIVTISGSSIPTVTSATVQNITGTWTLGPLFTVIGLFLAAIALIGVVIEMAIREALIFLVILFFPLGIAGLFYQGTWGWLKRMWEIFLSIAVSQLILAVVLVASIASFESFIGGGSLTDFFEWLAFLYIGAFSLPMALRLVPMAMEHGAAHALGGHLRQSVSGAIRGGHAGGQQHAKMADAAAATGSSGPSFGKASTSGFAAGGMAGAAVAGAKVVRARMGAQAASASGNGATPAAPPNGKGGATKGASGVDPKRAAATDRATAGGAAASGAASAAGCAATAGASTVADAAKNGAAHVAGEMDGQSAAAAGTSGTEGGEAAAVPNSPAAASAGAPVGDAPPPTDDGGYDDSDRFDDDPRAASAAPMGAGSPGAPSGMSSPTRRSAATSAEDSASDASDTAAAAGAAAADRRGAGVASPAAPAGGGAKGAANGAGGTGRRGSSAAGAPAGPGASSQGRPTSLPPSGAAPAPPTTAPDGAAPPAPPARSPGPGGASSATRPSSAPAGGASAGGSTSSGTSTPTTYTSPGNAEPTAGASSEQAPGSSPRTRPLHDPRTSGRGTTPPEEH